jgi:ribosome assembly protein 1
MTEKIIKSLNIKMLPRDLKYTDPKGPLQALFTNWLPLGKNLIDMIIDILPSPLEISEDRVEHLISNKIKPFKVLPKETQELKKGEYLFNKMKYFVRFKINLVNSITS